MAELIRLLDEYGLFILILLCKKKKDNLKHHSKYRVIQSESSDFKMLNFHK